MITISKLGAYLLVCAACASSVPLNKNNVTLVEKIDYRLPNNVIPNRYELELTPYLKEDKANNKKQFDFDGKVTITFQVKDTETKDVDEIVLHSYKDLKIDKTKTTLKEEEEIQITVGDSDETTDKLAIKLKDKKKLEKKKTYTLYFEFSGKLSTDMHGFYRSQYKRDGKDVFLASTQFQTIYARRAFPCFDEPMYKAKFQVTIIHHKEFNAVSNMKLDGEPKPKGDDMMISKFLETPKMSTYILAFLISDFEENPKDDKDFKVIARKEYKKQTDYSLTVGQTLLKKFNAYTGITYNQEMGNAKMHLAAIPDFSAGAMENWGLLTFRERALLYLDTDTTDSAKQSIAGVISHEQAHMWFGDYVTCEWWSYTWLNEGFARYFQYFITHEVEPTWEMDKQFVVDQIHSVFVMDSLDDSTPMTDTTVQSPTEVKRMFNSISYNKGAAIIRMFAYSMGESKFKEALQEYLKTMKEKSSTPEDLFKSFEKVLKDEEKDQEKDEEKVDMMEYFNVWTTNPGYPVITIEVVDGTEAKVTQKRFQLKPKSVSDELKYIVPLTFVTNKDPNFKDPEVKYLNKDTETIKLADEKIDWVVANVRQIGYYRVNYDEENWHNIHNALTKEDHSSIHHINRAQIIDDLMNFGISGLLEYDLILDILDYLKIETDYIPWTAALNGFKNLATRLSDENKNDFAKYISTLIEKVYSQLGFEQKPEDTHLDINNRAKVLSWVCKYGNTECISKSQELFNKLKENETPVPKNIRSPVYCTAIREGKPEDFKFLWDRYVNSDVATEKVLILNTLGCVKSDDEIKNYYKKILSDEIRLQDKSAALTSLYSENSENVEKVFKLIADKYEDLSKALGGDSEMVSVMSNIASKFTTEAQQTMLQEFLEKHNKLGDSEKKALEKSIQTVKENLNWSKEKLVKFNEKVKTKLGKDDKDDEKPDEDNSASLVKINFLVLILTIFVYNF